MADSEIKGLPQLLKACDKIPKAMEAETQDAARQVAREVVSGARGAARSPQQALAASTLSAGTDGDGGTVGSTWAGFAGSEFGGGARPTTRQFPPYRGKRGYFLYPSMRANASRLNEIWDDAMDRVGELWDYKPGVF